MSEELSKGILQGRVTGKKEFTEDEKKKNDEDFEKILKQYGVLKKNQSINDLNHPGDSRMTIVELIRKDKGIQKLKEDYKALYGKNAPPYNYDEYAGMDDYKTKLKELVEGCLRD